MYHFRNKSFVAPIDVAPSDAFAVKIVAVAHPNGKSWAAYQGPSSWTDQCVADQGDAIEEEIANALFYVLANSGLIYAVL